jgi:hypothetical protein
MRGSPITPKAEMRHMDTGLAKILTEMKALKRIRSKDSWTDSGSATLADGRMAYSYVASVRESTATGPLWDTVVTYTISGEKTPYKSYIVKGAPQPGVPLPQQFNEKTQFNHYPSPHGESFFIQHDAISTYDTVWLFDVDRTGSYSRDKNGNKVKYPLSLMAKIFDLYSQDVENIIGTISGKPPA